VTDWSSHIKNEIVRASQEASVPIEVLSEAQAQHVRNELCARYCEEPARGFGRNNLRDYASLHHPESFLWAADFLQENPGYLLYDSSHPMDRYAIKIPSGHALRSIIEECFGFQFYVTDEQFAFLLCSTDDDCLLGCGRARAWIESLLRHEEACQKFRLFVGSRAE
jgi:hypothetical protein